MKKLSYFLILTSLILAGCSSKTEIIRQEVPAGNSNNLPVPGNMGPGDSGGGTGKDGKPLESFRLDITQEENYVNAIAPVISALAPVHPGLAGDLLHIAKERSWYIVPGPLNKIPAMQMRVYFVETEQLAIQNLDEVWIDMKPYQGKMSAHDRARLLLHELLMGVRLLEFTSELDLCIADKAPMLLTVSPSDKTYRKERSSCFERKNGWSLGNTRQKISLVPQDYSDIRKLGTDLYEKCLLQPGLSDANTKICDISPAELDLWLKNTGFRQY